LMYICRTSASTESTLTVARSRAQAGAV